MANTNNTNNTNNSTDRNTDNMQREQGGFDKDRKNEQGQSGQREQGGVDKDHQEKGAIGGGEQKSEKGQTTGQFDKSRSEPTSR